MTGDWGGITLEGDGGELTGVLVRYAGERDISPENYYAAVLVTGKDCKVTDSVIEKSGRGIWVQGTGLSISATTIREMTNAHLGVNGIGLWTGTGNVYDLDRIIVSLHADTNTTLPATSDGKAITYRMWGDVTVPIGALTTIEAGVVIKAPTDSNSASANQFRVLGRLKSLGTTGNPVVFTSLQDDEYGGDTNGDGDQTLPMTGDWGGITLEGDGGELTGVLVRYAGER